MDCAMEGGRVPEGVCEGVPCGTPGGWRLSCDQVSCGRGSVCVCVGVQGGGGGWRHIIEEGLYGSAGGSERRAPVLQRTTLVVSALAPSVYATLT